MNAVDYVMNHDTESGNEQNDANELLKSKLPGDAEINLIEHKKLRLVSCPATRRVNRTDSLSLERSG